jgi:hypothetical protein
MRVRAIAMMILIALVGYFVSLVFKEACFSFLAVLAWALLVSGLDYDLIIKWHFSGLTCFCS